MPRIILPFLMLVLYGCSSPENTNTLPAEWEPQEALLLTYSGNPDNSITTQKVHAVCDSLILQLSPYIKIHLLVNEETNTDSLMKAFAAKGFHVTNINPIRVPDLFTMGVVRDYGPIVVRENHGKRALLRFNWDYVGADFLNPDTGWSRIKNSRRDKYFNQLSKLLNLDIITSPLTIEGGEIESNGKGTALIVDSFTRKRNPVMNDHTFDSLIFQSLGITNLIRLREGIAEDPAPGQSRISENIYGFGVGGHIDEFARFVNANTILLAMPTKEEASANLIHKINYERMLVNYKILEKAKDQDGNGFNIIEVPTPEPITEDILIDTLHPVHPVRDLLKEYPDLRHGTTIRFLPAMSYLNYIVLNELVILPRYYTARNAQALRTKDQKVRRIFEKAFPGKRVVQVNPTGLNYVGGGFHCWTQQIPF